MSSAVPESASVARAGRVTRPTKHVLMHTGGPSRTTSTLNGSTLQVQHDYHASTSSALFQGTVTLTNTDGTTALSDVRYRRAMDWDVPPGINRFDLHPYYFKDGKPEDGAEVYFVNGNCVNNHISVDYIYGMAKVKGCVKTLLDIDKVVADAALEEMVRQG